MRETRRLLFLYREQLEAKVAFTDGTGMKQAYEQALQLAKNEA